MTIKEKTKFFVQNGISISHIARMTGVENSTVGKWLRDEKGITHKNEEKILLTLQEITNNFVKILEE